MAKATTKAQQAATHQGRTATASRTASPAPTKAAPSRPAARLPAPAPTRPAARPAPAEPKRGVAAQTEDNTLPAFMQEDIGKGKENITQAEMEIPRLKLMQGLSKELQEYNELRPGMFFHPTTEMIFDEPFRAVVLHFDKRYILWRPLEDGGGIIARADDGVHWSPGGGKFTVKLDKKDGGATVEWTLAKTVTQSGLALWGTMNPDDPDSPPAATFMLNYLLAFPDYPDMLPAVLTFQRSSIKAGKKFNTKINATHAPLYGAIYEFSSYEDTNKNGQKFFNTNVRGAGLIQDPDLYQLYRQTHEQYAATGVNIKDIDGLQGEDPAGENEEGDTAQGGRRI